MKKYSVDVYVSRSLVRPRSCDDVSKARAERAYKEADCAVFYVGGFTPIKYKGNMWMDSYPNYKRLKEK